MNCDVISLPTTGGWLFGTWCGEARCEFLGATYRSALAVLDGPSGPLRAQVPVAFSLQFFVFGLQQKAQNMTPFVLAVAPHVLGQFVNLPGTLPIGREGAVNLDEWLEQPSGAKAPIGNLAEALDGGKAAHNRLCYEDVLRILLRHYDEAQPGSTLTQAEIAASPLKRRYYLPGVWSDSIGRLLQEHKLGGTLGPDGQRWLKPECVDEVRAFVKALESALIGPGGSVLPLTLLVQQGRRFDAWLALREILKAATRRLWIEDPYIDADVVALLGVVPDAAEVRVLTTNVYSDNETSALLGLADAWALLKRLSEQRSGDTEVRIGKKKEIHGRYIYVDDAVWVVSESLKDMACNTKTSLVRIPDETEARDALEDFERKWAAAQSKYSNR